LLGKTPLSIPTKNQLDLFNPDSTAQFIQLADNQFKNQNNEELDALLEQLSQIEPDDLSPRQAWELLEKLAHHSRKIRY